MPKTEDDPDSGLRADRARRRRRLGLLAVFGLGGGVAGGLVGGALGDSGSLASGTIPASIAVASAAIFVALLLFGGRIAGREFDEVELHNRRMAAKTALYGYALAYIPWYLLWRGALLPEPRHEILFGLIYVLLVAGYLKNKGRS